MSDKIRVLIIDDSIVIRKILTDVIDDHPDLEVIGTASNGKIGLRKIDQLEPDAVTLDIEMPEMDGLQTLKEIRKTRTKLPVIMFSTLSTKGGEATLEAISSGASDYVTKPANVGSAREAYDQVATELVPRLKLFGAKYAGKTLSATSINSTGTSLTGTSAASPATPKPVPARSPVHKGKIEAVVVGSSTGGPVALETMLRGIIKPLPVPMLIVQHMPPIFTKSLADRLDRKTPTTVVEAEDGQKIEPGVAYVAPGGHHMVLDSNGLTTKVRLHDGPLVNSCRPAVDELFFSSAKVWGNKQLAVILTGMGADGCDGSRVLRDAGADVFAQDEESSVVWGMPGAVVGEGLACDVLPLDDVGPAVTSRVCTPALGRLAAAGSGGGR